MIAVQIIFSVSLLLLAHTYIAYPLLLKIRSFFYSHSAKPTIPNFPFVSILIPAYNEEKVIGKKIQSILASNYPFEKIEILIGSDASTDGTNEIVKTFSNVKLIEFKGRIGKPAIINNLSKLAKNEILILTDANVMFDKNTIQELTKNFQNPEIALVDSKMINLNEQNPGVSKAEGTYVRGEVGIKNNEGKIFGLMMGPFGGCYALRKKFYTPVPENFLVDDFYINMKVLEKGGKSISEMNAKVFEEVNSNWKIEFKRKIRIATGSFQNLFAFSHLIFKFNTLAFCFISHKVLRWLGPFFMISLYLSNTALLLNIINTGVFKNNHTYSEILFYFNPELLFILVSFVLQNILILLFILDLLLLSININLPTTRLATHFLSTNVALVIGFLKFLRGVKSSVWQPTSRT